MTKYKSARYEGCSGQTAAIKIENKKNNGWLERIIGKSPEIRRIE